MDEARPALTAELSPRDTRVHAKHAARFPAPVQRLTPLGFHGAAAQPSVQAQGRQAWETPRYGSRRHGASGYDHPQLAKHPARFTAPVPRLTPLGFHGHPKHRTAPHRRVTSEGLSTPRETASVASGARMAERSQCRASQRAGMPDASVRRRGVGNPEACFNDTP